MEPKNIKKIDAVTCGILAILICVMIIAAIASHVINIVQLKSEAYTKSIAEVREIVDNAYNSNIYIQANIAEDNFIAFIYNKNKEAFSQSKQGGLAVYRNDNKIVSFGEELEITYSISPLRMIEYAVELAQNNKAKISKEDGEAGLTAYKISIKGDKNVRALYSKVDDHYAEDMMKMLYQYARESDRNMEIGVVKGQGGEFGAYCNIIVNGDAATVWQFDGYLNMFDWQLDTSWYHDDPSDTDNWVELANQLVDEIEQKTKSADIINDDREDGAADIDGTGNITD